MTQKQIKKYATSILTWEKVVQDVEASEQQKEDAKEQIMKLTSKIASLPYGFEVLMRVDEKVQQLMDN